MFLYQDMQHRPLRILPSPVVAPAHGVPKRPFPCPRTGCGKAFTVNGNLKKHIAAKHEHRKDFTCTFDGCNRKFAKKFNMLRHLNVHRNRSSHNTSSITSSPSHSNTHRRNNHQENNINVNNMRIAPWSDAEISVASFMAHHCDSPRPNKFSHGHRQYSLLSA